MTRRRSGDTRVELPETARVTVDDEHVPVARRARAALDRGVRRERVRAGVALVVVCERHGHPRLRAGDGRVRDADRAAVPRAGAEVGLEPCRRADARDPARRLRVDGQAGHVGVPERVGRSHGQAGAPGTGLPSARAAATSATSTRIEVQEVRRIPVTLAPSRCAEHGGITRKGHAADTSRAMASGREGHGSVQRRSWATRRTAG